MSVQGEINYSAHRLTESVIINDRLIKLINIDPHWQKHKKEGITEELIIRIVKSLNNGYFFPDGKQEKNKNYFKDYPVCERKRYKIIWWWWKEKELDKIYIRACHRVKKKI